METQYNPSKYLRYDELTQLLKSWNEEFSKYTQLESVGQSREGRDLWLMTLTDPSTGKHQDKPAYWVSGNIHASELTGCQASLHVIHKVLSGIDKNEHRFRELLKHNTLYVLPRISPDGAEHVMNGFYVRSVNDLYPHTTDPKFKQVDLDGDGKIRSMLVPSPSGTWKKSKSDPRILLLREPNDFDSDETYYHLYPEGRPEERGEGTWYQNEFGQDYNRNFPVRWRPEGLQMGAGQGPLLNPETRAIAQAVLDRPNIIGAQDFHTFSAIILRPGFFEADSEMDHTDLKIFKALGKKGEELTGYPCVSVAEDFCYDHKNHITGGFLDWMYATLGIYGYTNEIWSVFKQAGIQIGKSDHVKFLLRALNEEEQLKVIAWCEDHCPKDFFKDWTAVDHPELGPVEVGGWDRVSPIGNPPENLLEAEVEGNAEFALYCAEANPRLEMTKSEVEMVDEATKTRRISIEIENSGYLSTRGANIPGLEKTLPNPFAEIKLGSGQKLVQGARFERLPHLSGRSEFALFDTQMMGPSIKSEETQHYKVKRHWLVQGEGEIHLEINYPRGRSFHLTW